MARPNTNAAHLYVYRMPPRTSRAIWDRCRVRAAARLLRLRDRRQHAGTASSKPGLGSWVLAALNSRAASADPLQANSTRPELCLDEVHALVSSLEIDMAISENAAAPQTDLP